MVINLFEQTQMQGSDRPLAYRMRPQCLEDLYGQEEIIGEGKLLRRAIEADKVQSLILYGPPGTGKTSLAQIIAKKTKSEFVRINAVTSGIKEIREVIKKAKANLALHRQKTILFIDEIHRFNKTQQDALLPSVEEGIIIMIGATTENPYFEVNSPLLSRSRIFSFVHLKDDDIVKILLRALHDEERGLGKYNVKIGKEDLKYLASLAGGDARNSLNALELAVLTTPLNGDGVINIDRKVIAESMQKKFLFYDKNGDNHYDTVSAFIKSMRGSDPDGALFWLAKMIEAGEDPKFIARRIIVHAAEDVGLADPFALLIANAAARAVEYVGLPEARIPLAEAVVYIATAPKSNSIINAINLAEEAVRNNPNVTVPSHLRDSHYQGAEELGHGKDYKYPHDYPNHYVKQQYLPTGLTDFKFYRPSLEGKEAVIKKQMQKQKVND